MTPDSSCGNIRLQRLLLRVIAAVSFLALPAVRKPRMAVEKLSWLGGFGEPPDVPLLLYMTAGGSCVFLAQAVLLWIMSGDVVRYRPLVLMTAWAYLAFGPVFLWIDSQSGMPHWWVAMDSLGCLTGGSSLLLACYKGQSNTMTGK